MDLDVFREIRDGIKKSSDLIIELSTGGGPTLPVADKIGPLSLKPELATLNTFLIVLSVKDGRDQPIIYTRSEIEHTAKRAKEMGVKPVMTILSLSGLEEVENLIAKGLVDKPYYFQIGLNIQCQGSLKGTPKNLTAIVERLPEGAIFTSLANGEAQLPLTTMSMLLGGHVRVGLEDNIYYAPGRLAMSNAELVARTVRIAKELNYEIATPDDGREILQIKK
jgi:3-keto-5-aminohexanoate cleavage enzyme